MDEEEIRRGAAECHIEGRRFRVLDDEYALVCTLLSIFTDLQLGIVSLKSFLDLDRMVKAMDGETDWTEFLERRKPERLFLICLNLFDVFLGLLDCSSRYPKLSRCVDRDRAFVRAGDETELRRLLERSRFALHNRRWALGLYETSPVRSVLWSLASIPFRIAAYESRDPRPIGWLRDRAEAAASSKGES